MYLYYLLFIFTLFSCISPSDVMETKNTEIIHVSDGSDSISTLELLKIIPLETNDESVFGELYKLDIINKEIYVLDNTFVRNLIKFDSLGNLISVLPKGKGPSEVLFPYCVYFDQESTNILVFDSGNKLIKVFTSDFHYIDFIEINNGISYQHFSKTENNKWLIFGDYISIPDRDTTARYLLLDSSFMTIQQKFLPFQLEHTNFVLLDPINSMESNQIAFSNILDNNIYTISNNILSIKYKVDFGEYNLSEEEQKLSIYEILKLWQDGYRKTEIDGVIENINFFGFSYSYLNRTEFCIFSKVYKKTISSESFDESTFIPGKLVSIADDYFVVAAEPSDVMNYIQQSDEIIEKYKKLNIKEGDNPVLIYYSLKDLF